MNGFCPLASGSKGNSIYFGTNETRILIDAGISAGALVKKLTQIHVDIKTIQAILITHEHTDHIRGLPLICEKFNIKISSLGRGLSTGTELEYSDNETLKNALKNRQ